MAWFDAVITQQWSPPTEYGVDLATPYDTPITSPFSGIVEIAGLTKWNNGTTSGGLVSVRTAQGDEYFLHLDSLASNIASGAYVSSGQIIGYSGGQTSGGNWPTSRQNSTGPHTEYGLNAPFIGDATGNINPLPIINALRNGLLSSGQSLSNSNPTSPTAAAINNILASLGIPIQNLHIQDALTSISTTIQTDILKVFISLGAIVAIAVGVYIATMV